jgi:hypothetical protein
MGGIFPLARSDKVLIACGLLVGVAMALALTWLCVRTPDTTVAIGKARDALRAIKQLEAKTEIGLTYAQYVDAVGKTWVEVKPFVESSDGRKYPEFSSLLTNIIAQYQAGMELWQRRLHMASNTFSPTSHYWIEAAFRITEAEELLDAQLGRARNPRVVEIEREIDAILPEREELLDEHTRLFSETEGYSRKLEAYKTLSRHGYSDDWDDDMAVRLLDIKSRSDEIKHATSVGGEKLKQLDDERSALLRQGGGRGVQLGDDNND